MGITWWQFWELNPHIIKCISKGYKEQKIEKDAMMHAWWGTYGLSAVAVAVEHCLNGKKAKSEIFFDKKWRTKWKIFTISSFKPGTQEFL